MARNTPRDATFARDQPKIAAVAEHDLVPMNVGKAQQPSLGHLLGERNTGEKEQSGYQTCGKRHQLTSGLARKFSLDPQG